LNIINKYVSIKSPFEDELLSKTSIVFKNANCYRYYNNKYIKYNLLDDTSMQCSIGYIFNYPSKYHHDNENWII
jgi:hypothetical protein